MVLHRGLTPRAPSNGTSRPLRPLRVPSSRGPGRHYEPSKLGAPLLPEEIAKNRETARHCSQDFRNIFDVQTPGQCEALRARLATLDGEEAQLLVQVAELERELGEDSAEKMYADAAEKRATDGAYGMRHTGDDENQVADDHNQSDDEFERDGQMAPAMVKKRRVEAKMAAAALCHQYVIERIEAELITLNNRIGKQASWIQGVNLQALRVEMAKMSNTIRIAAAHERCMALGKQLATAHAQLDRVHASRLKLRGTTVHNDALVKYLDIVWKSFQTEMKRDVNMEGPLQVLLRRHRELEGYHKKWHKFGQEVSMKHNAAQILLEKATLLHEYIRKTKTSWLTLSNSAQQSILDYRADDNLLPKGQDTYVLLKEQLEAMESRAERFRSTMEAYEHEMAECVKHSDSHREIWTSSPDHLLNISQQAVQMAAAMATTTDEQASDVLVTLDIEDVEEGFDFPPPVASAPPELSASDLDSPRSARRRARPPRSPGSPRSPKSPTSPGTRRQVRVEETSEAGLPSRTPVELKSLETAPGDTFKSLREKVRPQQ